MVAWIGNKKPWIATILTTLTVGTSGALYGADQAQNPYIDKGTHYELPVRSDIPQGERVEIHKDIGKIDLIGWNDEYRISIEPQIPTANFGAVDRPFPGQANRPLLSNRLEYKSGNVTAFIQPKTENEFDIDFTLDAKPDTNVFTYKITGADDFVFAKQTDLTPEQQATGAQANPEMIGAYVVYHKSKRNYHLGQTNYATGKVMDIHIPYAFDNNGASAKCDLTYSSAVLSVTCPQQFLDNAVYPVLIDPTFGYTSIPVSFTYTLCNVTSDTSNSRGMAGTPFNTTEDAQAFAVSVALRGSAAPENADLTFRLYTEDSAASDSHDVYASSELLDQPIPNGALQFYTSYFSSPVSVTTSQNYIQGIICNGEDLTSTAILMAADALGDSNREYFETATGAGSYATRVAENPWTEVDSATGSRFGIYTIYCVTGNTCPVQHTFSSPGYTTWTVPTGVTSADIACIGGGGAGFDGSTAGGGKGGGGGAFSSTTQSVTPGDTIRIYIGSGGATSAANGEASTASTTAPATIVSADFGRGGTSATTGGGAGGTAAASTGTTKRDGGTGGNGNGTDDAGGGGGGAGGQHAAGTNGTNASTSAGGGGGQGDGTSGGAGGNGGNGGVCTAGTSDVNGGGGGGGADNGGIGCLGGAPGAGGGGGELGQGAGRAGQCQITYTITATAGGGTPATINQYNVIWLD